jgi:hypothetical protein
MKPSTSARRQNTLFAHANTAHRAVGLSIAAVLFVGASTASARDVQWQVSVALPTPIPAVAVVGNVAPQAFPVYTPAPAPVYIPAPVYVAPPAPAVQQPVAPALPNIEQIQAQQQSRIQWASNAGLLTPHEYSRLQQTQQYIEEQRRWAYSDGWLTYEEQRNIVSLQNDAVAGIEEAINNGRTAHQYRYNNGYGYGNGYSNNNGYGYRSSNVGFAMPPVLTVWDLLPFDNFYNRDRNHGRGHGNGQGHRGHEAPNNFKR